MYERQLNYMEVSNLVEEEDTQTERAESETMAPEDMKFDGENGAVQNKQNKEAGELKI